MQTKSNNFLLEKEIEWENIAPGIKRQVMGYDEYIMMVKIAFEAGAIGALHEHFHSQTTYVVNGKFEFTLENEKQIVSAGDCLYFDPNRTHGVECIESGILIDVFSPMRKDFLK